MKLHLTTFCCCFLQGILPSDDESEVINVLSDGQFDALVQKREKESRLPSRTWYDKVEEQQPRIGKRQTDEGTIISLILKINCTIYRGTFTLPKTSATT